jgi:kynurenine formamidase
MTIVLDLSHTLAEGMPVYPGTEPPTLRQANTVAKDGFAEKLLTMYSHTGTHIDAPAHMLAGGATLDQLGAGHFVGRACVLDVAGQRFIEQVFLAAQASLIEGSDFVLFHTGWSRFWGQEAYFEAFPVLTPEATQWLAARSLKGIGFDAISVDPVGSTDFANHLVLFRQGMISIENLTGLEPLIGKRFLFSCLPLKIEEADGSPVRAVAILD